MSSSFVDAKFPVEATRAEMSAEELSSEDGPDSPNPPSCVSEEDGDLAAADTFLALALLISL